MEPPATLPQRRPPTSAGAEVKVTKPFRIKNMLSNKQRKALRARPSPKPIIKNMPEIKGMKLKDRMAPYPRLANESVKSWKLRVVRDLRSKKAAKASPKAKSQPKAKAKAKAAAQPTKDGRDWKWLPTTLMSCRLLLADIACQLMALKDQQCPTECRTDVEDRRSGGPWVV